MFKDYLTTFQDYLSPFIHTVKILLALNSNYNRYNLDELVPCADLVLTTRLLPSLVQPSPNVGNNCSL
jgi:hypothetical protein